MIPDLLYYILMIGYFFYIIFRFSKPAQYTDKVTKKEPDTYNIKKVYNITSILFVISTFFVLNPILTSFVPFHSYLKYPLVLFGIFNAVMTVLYIKYRDDIYFYESYNLCFTIVIIFTAIYFILNPAADMLFQSGVEYSHQNEDVNTFSEKLKRHGHTIHKREKSHKEYNNEIPIVSPHATIVPIVQGYTHNFKTDQLGHGYLTQDDTLHQKYDEFKKSEFSRVPGSYERAPKIPSFNSFHQKRGQTDTFNSHDQETFQNKFHQSNGRNSSRNSMSGILQTQENLF